MRYVSIDVVAWTFFHYIEQCNNVEYRFIKNFKSKCIRAGRCKVQMYSMFVRYLCLEVDELPFWKNFLDKTTIEIGNIPIDIIFCKAAFKQISDDIVNNNARNLVTYNRDMAMKNLQIED